MKEPEEPDTLEQGPSKTHDGIFKQCISDLTVARDFLNAHLPAKVQELLDFSTLRLDPGSFIEKPIKQFCSDILYRLKTKQGKNCYIYCLIEHQSTADPLMPFRLLRYSLAVLQRYVDQAKNKQQTLKSLPLVVPLLFYHGQKRPYPHTDKMRFVDCFEEVELAEWLYHGPLPLVDVSTVPDEEILTHKSVALLETVLKHIWSRDLLAEVALLAKAWLISNLNSELSKQLMYYIDKVAEISDEKAFVESLIREAPQFREDVMTISERFEQRGIQQGMQQGMQQVAKRLLAKGMPVDDIMEITGLTKKELKQLH